jgi:hypothetical protein
MFAGRTGNDAEPPERARWNKPETETLAKLYRSFPKQQQEKNSNFRLTKTRVLNE